MKMISWNCNGGFREKFHALESLNADIFIIQECEDPSQAKSIQYSEWANDYLWAGKSKHKGIGVFAKKGNRVKPIELATESLKIFLPFTINDDLNVLAVWTQETESGAFRYIGQMWQYLQLHKNFFKSNNHLIIGDFNSNKIWDRKRNIANHSHVVDELKEIGISSSYHQIYGCDQGSELHPTFYMYRKLEKPYHIDYAFASENIIKNSNVEIGSPDQWLTYSDHMPLTFTVNNLNSNCL